MERQAEYGWVFYGPDGNWHWSETYDESESVTDQRPATAIEAALAHGGGKEIQNATDAMDKWADIVGGGGDYPGLAYDLHRASSALKQVTPFPRGKSE